MQVKHKVKVIDEHSNQITSFSQLGLHLEQLYPLALSVIKTRKPCYRKDDRAMRPIYGCPEKFRWSLATLTATFPEIVNVLLL